jgi:hypothetical protein
MRVSYFSNYRNISLQILFLVFLRSESRRMGGSRKVISTHTVRFIMFVHGVKEPFYALVEQKQKLPIDLPFKLRNRKLRF